jgi:hypothetical protein
LENLGIEMDNNAAWETSTENIKIWAKENLDCYEFEEA